MAKTITLEYKNLETQECEIIGIFDVNEKDYMALKPIDKDETYIYGYNEKKDGSYTLSDIKDEAEFRAAETEFKDIMEG